MGETIAAVISPTTIKIAPAIPESVSEYPYGLRIWVTRDETLLKNPTYTANGTRINQNSSVPSNCLVAGINGVRGLADEALGGVGGAAGIKNDGIDATLDYTANCQLKVVSLRDCWQLTMMEMYRTILGISEGFVAHSESTNWPIAAPKGLAKLARAVALVRPLSENHRSL